MSVIDLLENKGVRLDALYQPTFEQSPARIIGLSADAAASSPIGLYIQEQYGRFGNNIYQLLHALIVARHLNINLVSCSFYLDIAQTRYIALDNVVIEFGVLQPPQGPLLCATMFHPHGFEKIVIDALNSDLVKSDAEKIARGLFGRHQTLSHDPTRKTVIFHFRSGDIFEPHGHINSLYAQPPLSYYIKSLDHICETIGNFEILVVYENDRNPCIKSFLTVLSDRGLHHTVQSSSFYDDATAIIRSECIVSSFSSFCEALALMSDNIRRWYTFRSSAVYEDVTPSICQSFSKILRRDGVEIYRINDVEGSYIPRGGWFFSPAQIDQMLNYPIGSLSLDLVN